MCIGLSWFRLPKYRGSISLIQVIVDLWKVCHLLNPGKAERQLCRFGKSSYKVPLKQTKPNLKYVHPKTKLHMTVKKIKPTTDKYTTDSNIKKEAKIFSFPKFHIMTDLLDKRFRIRVPLQQGWSCDHCPSGSWSLDQELSESLVTVLWLRSQRRKPWHPWMHICKAWTLKLSAITHIFFFLNMHNTFNSIYQTKKGATK